MLSIQEKYEVFQGKDKMTKNQERRKRNKLKGDLYIDITF